MDTRIGGLCQRCLVRQLLGQERALFYDSLSGSIFADSAIRDL
jgi:hypothetical protein